MIPVPCKAGDLVEVRSAAEIFATLDDQGCLERLPFMPEMLQYCGRRYKVAASAHKSCDSTYFGLGRAMTNAVFLEDLRCDGSAHDGCEARCLLFFKLEWLKPVSPSRNWHLASGLSGARSGSRDTGWLKATVKRNAGDTEITYRCQATEHLNSTTTFESNAWSMFVADVRSRNASVGEIVRAMSLLFVRRLQGLPFGWRLWTATYEALHRAYYGTRGPYFEGTVPSGQPTPEVRTNLQSGDVVRVRTLDEISSTLNHRSNRNRGLSFNMEMSPFCGGVYRVERRVTRIVDEKSGRMLQMKGPCIMLEGGHCKARYHPDAVLCRRKIPQYFREAWLERVEAPKGSRESS